MWEVLAVDMNGDTFNEFYETEEAAKLAADDLVSDDWFNVNSIVIRKVEQPED